MSELTSQHVPVGSIRDGKQMRRDLISTLSQVESDGCLGIDRVPLVGIDSHAEQTRVGLNVKRKHSDFIEFLDSLHR